MVIETARHPPFFYYGELNMPVQYDTTKSVEDEVGCVVEPGDRVVALTKSWGYPSFFKATFEGYREVDTFRWGHKYRALQFIVKDEEGHLHILKANRILKI